MLADARSAEADLVAGRAEAAVPVVRDVLPQWRGRLVVEVPASEAGLDAALAADPGTYANIAAVTASVDGTVDSRLRRCTSSSTRTSTTTSTRSAARS